MAIEPGYMGSAELPGGSVRCTTMTASVDQQVLVYNSVYGVNDQGSGIYKSDSPGDRQIQRAINRMSPWKAVGSISFPMSCDTGDAQMSSIAYTGSEFDVTMKFACSYGCKFTSCRINSFSMSCSAGELMTVNAEWIAKDLKESGGSSPTSQMEQLVTWDTVNCSAPVNGEIQGFSVNINNAANVIYTNGTALQPSHIRLGVQEISGTISVYSQGKSSPLNVVTQGVFSVSWPSGSFQATVCYLPAQNEGSVGPFICTIPFTNIA